MGRKVHPVGQRLKINREWKSKWFSVKNYRVNLLEDFALRNAIVTKLKKTAGICEVDIKRSAHQIEIAVHTSRPGVIIGRGGAGIDELRKLIEKITKDKLNLQIMEIKNPYLSAATVFTQIAEQIEKRIAYRRAVKKAIEQVMKAGAMGVKVTAGGRLNGADISRSETFIEGTVPLSTFRADIDYYSGAARTTYGAVGLKVWIYKKAEENKAI